MKSWLLLLASGVIVFLLTASGVAQGQAERPPYREGEFWQFKYRSWDWPLLSYNSARLIDGVYEVVYSREQFKTFYLGSQRKEELSPPNSQLMYLLNLGPDFQFPLTRGKKWSYEYNRMIHIPEPSHVRFDRHVVEILVTGMERVTTDAGVFNAFKVAKKDRRIDRPSGPVTTFYFSPETRSIVRMFGAKLVDFPGRPGRIEILLIKHGGAGATGESEAVREVEKGS